MLFWGLGIWFCSWWTALWVSSGWLRGKWKVTLLLDLLLSSPELTFSSSLSFLSIAPSFPKAHCWLIASSSSLLHSCIVWVHVLGLRAPPVCLPVGWSFFSLFSYLPSPVEGRMTQTPGRKRWSCRRTGPWKKVTYWLSFPGLRLSQQVSQCNSVLYDSLG